MSIEEIISTSVKEDGGRYPCVHKTVSVSLCVEDEKSYKKIYTCYINDKRSSRRVDKVIII